MQDFIHVTASGEEVAAGSAQHAYDVYGEAVGYKNFRGDPMPAFDDLPAQIRGAWNNVAVALHQSGVDAGTIAAAHADLNATYGLLLKEAARVCHAANQALQRATGEPVNPDWDGLSQDLRESTMKGVRFALENPDVTPEQQHEAWCEERRSQGYVFGKTKDHEAKTHPCLVPYEDLPAMQRAKDGVFQAVARAYRDAWCARRDAPSPGSLDTVRESRSYRQQLDAVLQQIKEPGTGRTSRERSLAITKLQEAIMWLGMDLKAQKEEGLDAGPNPYPASYDASSAAPVASTADGLTL